MAYLRRITELPSRAKSRYHVIGGPDGILNMDAGELIPYSRMRELLKKATKQEVVGELEKKLELNHEEADYMAGLLFYELDHGEWDKPFDFEKNLPKPFNTSS